MMAGSSADGNNNGMQQRWLHLSGWARQQQVVAKRWSLPYRWQVQGSKKRSAEDEHMLEAFAELWHTAVPCRGLLFTCEK